MAFFEWCLSLQDSSSFPMLKSLHSNLRMVARCFDSSRELFEWFVLCFTAWLVFLTLDSLRLFLSLYPSEMLIFVKCLLLQLSLLLCFSGVDMLLLFSWKKWVSLFVFTAWLVFLTVDSLMLFSSLYTPEILIFVKCLLLQLSLLFCFSGVDMLLLFSWKKWVSLFVFLTLSLCFGRPRKKTVNALVHNVRLILIDLANIGELFKEC